MPTPNNAVTTADVVRSLDIEMLESFDAEMNSFTELLGLFPTEVVAAGTALYQYKVTGALSTTEVAEGDEVPLSKYKAEQVPVGDLSVKPYRKLTTVQAVLKAGFVNAVVRTDKKMLNDVRTGILTDLFALLSNGTGTATGTDLQAALAKADATLGDAMEANGDSPDNIVHFVNRQDIADYLAKAAITTQDAFGLGYLQSFLGAGNVLITSKVAAGTIYATPASNIHVYGTDFSALGGAGISYEVSESSLIGVHHEASYARTSSETNVLCGTKMVPEVKDYIVRATITPSPAKE